MLLAFGFRRAFPHGGAFWVFRAELHGMIGYFDEQLAAGPDLELSLRIAMQKLKMGRVDGLLGYFTNEGLGLSTRDDFAVIDQLQANAPRVSHHCSGSNLSHNHKPTALAAAVPDM